MLQRHQVKFQQNKAIDTFDNGMHPHELNYFRELLYGKCLRRGKEYDFPCKFMRKSRMERLFEKGRESLKSEIDVIRFLT